MNSISIFKNEVKEFEIDGYTFKADQISVYDLYQMAEDEFKRLKLKDAKMFMDNLTGKEKIAFMKEILNDLPVGEQLAIELQKFIESTAGIFSILKFILKKNNPELTNDNLNSIISPTNFEQFLPIYNYSLSGIGEDEQQAQPETEVDPFEAEKKKDTIS